MDLKSGLKRAGLWLTLVIGVFCIGAVLLIISNERVPSGSTGVSRDFPAQAAAVQMPGGQVIQEVANTAELKDENDSARQPETLFSKPDEPTEISANSTSPQGISREDQEYGQVEQVNSGEGMTFRRLSLQDENGVIDPDGLRNARQQVEGMKEFRARRRLQGEGGSDAGGITPSTWTWLGPGNIGGRIRTIAIQPGNANNMFVGSVAGGIWRTSNAGVSWSPVNDFMANLAVTTIVINPANNNIMFAGTGEGGFTNNTGTYIDLIQGAGIFRSGDQGVTWTQLAATNNANFNTVNRMAISPNGATILAGTGTGVWRSTDSGANWTAIPSFAGNIQDVDFSPTDSLNAVAAMRGFAAYSTDGGANWTQATFNPDITAGLTLANDGRVELAYAPSAPLTVYASVNNNNGDVYQSIDGGHIYNIVSTGTSYMNTGNGSQGFYDNIVWVNPLDPNFVIVGGVTLQRSTNGGVNFSDISSGCNPISNHADQHFIVAPPAFNNTTNRTVFFANDGGIYRADDVATVCVSSPWTELNNNLGITQFYGAAGNPNSGIIIGGTQDNGTLRFSGGTENWTQMQGSDGGYVAADQTDANFFYGETQNLGVVRSIDAGVNSVSINGGIADAPLSQANFIAPLTLDPNEPNRLLAGGWSLWRSNDVKNTNPAQNSGLPTWTAIKQPVAPRAPGGATPRPTPPISAIAISPNNPDFIVVGHNDGKIYLTLDGTGTNPPPTAQCAGGFSPCWSRIDNIAGTQLTPVRFVTRIVIDETRGPNWIYATFGGFSSDNVYVTKDLGASWADITGTGPTGLPDVPVRSLTIHPVKPNTLYVGTEVGIFASEDAGATWSLPQDGPANVSVDQLVWMGGSLLAATYGRGVYVSGQTFISNGGGVGGGGTGISCPGGSGLWNDPLMWPGGHVPTSTDDVAVVCPIKAPGGALARNIRVNSILTTNAGVTTVEDLGNFGTIQPDISLPGTPDIYCRNLSNSGTMNNIRVMTASGDVVNGGTININTMQSKGLRNAGALNAENVTVHGDFDNSGSMMGISGASALAFTGGPAHNFQGGGQTKFANLVVQSGETVKFLSSMTFDVGTFNSNGTMDFNGQALNFIGNSYLSGGGALGPGTLNMAPTLGTGVLAGNAPAVTVASGLVNYSGGGTFSGPLTVAPSATFRLNAATVTLNGNVTVNGAITRETVYGGNGINFFGGTFTNNGSVTADIVRFNPFGPTPLAQNIAGPGVWFGGAIQMGNNLPATPSTVTLQNDVTFAMDEVDVSYSFNLNGHVLTYTGIGSPGVSVGGLLAGPGTFRMQPAAGTPVMRMFPGGTWGSDLNIAYGTVKTNTAFGNFVLTGPLTVDAGATLRLDGFGNDFRGNVLNNGTINMLNGSSALEFRGSSFTNNGSIDATNVFFFPLVAQQMDLSGNGAWTGAGTLYLDTLASTRFTSDVTYGSGNLQTYGSLQGVDPSIFSVPCTVPWTGPGDVTGNIRRTNLAACPGATLRFGSPFTTITFNSGTPPSDVLVSSVSSPLVPPGFPNAVQRLYTITPTGGSGYSATLRLHYLDSELNGNAENALELFRFDGSSWTQQGATNRDSVNNWVEYSGVTQFSPWAISGSGPAAPTPTPPCVVSGTPDTSFNGTGKVTTPIGGSYDLAQSVAIQSDGRIVAAGYTDNGVNEDFALARYNTDGTLDTSFNGTGKVTTAIGSSYEEAYSVAIQSDGRIVAAGYSDNGPNQDFALVRYNTDGTLDTSFNGTGKVTTPVGSGDDIAQSIAIQSDGRIVAAGYRYNGSNQDIALVRYNTDGTLDTSFNGNGKVTTPIGSSDDIGRSVAIQSDGRIVVAGYSIVGADYDFALVRYNTDGTLDTSFNGTGKVTTPVGSDTDQANSVAIQSDGRIVAAGYSVIGSTADFGLVRYNTDGTLDTSFNGTGKVMTPIGSSNGYAFSVAIQSDAKIVAAGQSSNGANDDFAIIRYNTDGTLDTSLNGTGKVTTPIGSSYDIAQSVAIQSDGRIVAGGYSNNGSDEDFALVRYNGACSGPTATPTSTATNTPTSTPTNTPTFSPTNTPTPTDTPTDTPTATPAAGTISGTVTYGNAAAPPKYISNVTVTGTGSPNVFTTTGAPGGTAGQYTLTGFGAGSYTVSLSKTTGQNGINSFDAARVAQHVAGTGPGSFTTNEQRISADVTNNGAINSFDAGKIAQYTAGLPLVAPNLSGTWRFFVPNPTFPLGASPTSRTYPSITSNITGDDYVGLLIGEVTGNWTPSAARPVGSEQLAEGSAGSDARVSAGPERGIAVELPDVSVNAGKEVVIPVNVQSISDKGVISYEFDLRYDPSAIQPVADVADVKGTASRGLSVVTNATEPGLLRVVVYGPLPIDKDGVLLNLRFTAVGAAGLVSPISFERIMFNDGEMQIALTNGRVALF